MTIMTGRPETPLPETGPLAALARRLRELREEKGMSYREMAAIANYTAPALSTAANGKRLPPLHRVLAYVTALGVDEFTRAEVEQLWRNAQEETRRTRAPRRRAEPTAQPSYQASPDLSVIIPFVTDSLVYFSADPRQVTTFEEFSAALNQILSESGMSVAELIGQSSIPTASGGQMVQLKKTTVYDVLGGKVRPSSGFTQMFLRSCGMARDRVEAWVARLEHLHAVTSAVEELARNPHPDGQAIDEIRTALRGDQYKVPENPAIAYYVKTSSFDVDHFEIASPGHNDNPPPGITSGMADFITVKEPTSWLRMALAISTSTTIVLAITVVWMLTRNY